MDLKLQTLILILQFKVLFGVWRAPELGRIRIYLDEDESLIIPKHHQTEFKILSPVTLDDKFYAQLSKINKKPLKYVKHTPVSKLKSTFEAAGSRKKCCGNEWTLGDTKEVNLEELFRPVSLPSPHIHDHEYHNFEDIKPVTELIEDDLKYDFRTKTHSFR